MKIYDAHAHIFPQKIAEKASRSIGDFYDGAPMFCSALLENLKKHGNLAGIEKLYFDNSSLFTIFGAGPPSLARDPNNF